MGKLPMLSHMSRIHVPAIVVPQDKLHRHFSWESTFSRVKQFDLTGAPLSNLRTTPDPGDRDVLVWVLVQRAVFAARSNTHHNFVRSNSPCLHTGSYFIPH